MPHRDRLALPVLALAIVASGLSSARAQETPRAVQRTACGGYDVVPSGFRRAGEPTRLSIQKGGRLLVSITDWRVTGAACEDVTADKVPDLVIRTFSGGAHCCETIRVYALDDAPKLLLTYEANNAMGVEVRDLEGDGRPELILGDDTFAYFDDLCYACSPSHLPLVACYTGTRFEDCTRRFPDLVRTCRDTYLARVGPAPDEAALAQVKGAALGVLATSAMLAGEEEEEALRAVREAGAADAVLDWLKKVMPRVREWVGTRGKKLKDAKGG